MQEAQTLLMIVYGIGALGFVLIAHVVAESDSGVQEALSLARTILPDGAISGVMALTLVGVSILWPLYAVRWLYNLLCRSAVSGR